MTGSDFLDTSDGELTGVMYRMQLASKQWGLPIRAWIIEQNRADWLSSNAMEQFKKSFDIAILTPRTGLNKTDNQFGVEALLVGRYRSGSKRLPWLGVDARNCVRQKITELTSWPHIKSDDTVMAEWLGELELDQVIAAGSRPSAPVDIGPPGLTRWAASRQRVGTIDRSRLDGEPEPEEWSILGQGRGKDERLPLDHPARRKEKYADVVHCSWGGLG